MGKKQSVLNRQYTDEFKVEALVVPGSTLVLLAFRQAYGDERCEATGTSSHVTIRIETLRLIVRWPAS